MTSGTLKKRLFSISDQSEFEDLALDVFRFQYEHVKPYRQFCKALNYPVNQVSKLEEIPFMPIQFFKTHKITAGPAQSEQVFTSSGTSGNPSRHYIKSLRLYKKAFRNAFSQFYGDISDFVVLALLPSYLERKGSSLIYMVSDFIEKSKKTDSGFYLYDHKELSRKLRKLDAQGQKILLIGVSFALLDLIENQNFKLNHTIIMETGGMKGRRKEMTRPALHKRLCRGFGVNRIHSEYGMAELLSQAYSTGNGIFQCPSTLQVLVREPEDPFHILGPGQNGGLNIIDLANLYSCSFIATQDLGRLHSDGSFEILGRFDHSDLRGCTLLLIE